jgi:hypothetical protein
MPSVVISHALNGLSSCEALELSRRVGSALEHLERPFGHECAQRAKLHLLHLLLDGGVSCVAAHVLDHSRPTVA